jgi:FkbM family methyltransferase
MSAIPRFIAGKTFAAEHSSEVREPLAGAGSETRRAPDSDRTAEMIAEAAGHAKAGRFAKALGKLAQSLEQRPKDPQLIYERALTLFDWGRLREARDGFTAAEELGLSSFGLHLNLGHACHLMALFDEAEKHVRRAIDLDENISAAHLGLGAVLQASKRFDEAIQCFERAHLLGADPIDCLTYIASCKVDQKDGPGGEDVIRRAISLNANGRPRCWVILGVALSLQDRNGEASEAFEHAEEIEARTGQPTEAFVAHGVHLLNIGQVNKALDLYAKYLPSHPHAAAQNYHAWALLTAGRLREGWVQYEFRWCQDPLLSVRPPFGKPQWNGQDLEGKTVVLWAEQGIGDTVQFARLACLLKARGALVVLHVPVTLKGIAQYFDGVDRVILSPNELPAGFDYQIATMSLPRALEIELHSIPTNIPYLRTDAHRAQRWREQLQSETRLKVGLVWAGNPKHARDRFRSIPFTTLAPFLDIDGAQFFSLQKESPVDLASQAYLSRRLVDLAPQLNDLCDTAAAIEALDLVICVDTAVAHIAGALGRPVWVMLPAAGDFRWLTGRDDSPWYPTMRLFTQRQLGDWNEVVARVALALIDAVHAHSVGKSPAVVLGRSLDKAGPDSADDSDERRAFSLSRVTESRFGIVQYLPDEEMLGRSLDRYGEWLQPQIDLIGRLLRAGATAIEAGSGIGAHSLALARVLGPTGHLFAYEPDPIHHRILIQNLTMNGLRRLVTVMKRELTCRLPSQARSDTDLQSCTNEAGELHSDAIDELILAKLDLIKLSERSNPHAVLDGGAATIWRLRPLVFVAIPLAADLRTTADHVKTFSYRCWEVATPFFSATNYNRRVEDVFQGEGSTALLAIPEETTPHAAVAGLEEV